MYDGFNRIAAAGIIKPGEKYVLLRDSDDVEEIPFLHIIMDAEGLVVTIMMALYMTYGKRMELGRIIGIKSDLQDRHIIRLSCENKKEGNRIVVELVLARLLPFHEAFAKMLAIFGLE